jgi:hypothetical protein
VRDLFVNRKKRLLSALCAGALAAGLMLADYVLGVLRLETACPDHNGRFNTASAFLAFPPLAKGVRGILKSTSLKAFICIGEFI